MHTRRGVPCGLELRVSVHQVQPALPCMPALLLTPASPALPFIAGASGQGHQGQGAEGQCRLFGDLIPVVRSLMLPSSALNFMHFQTHHIQVLMLCCTCSPLLRCNHLHATLVACKRNNY
jgi:hypothetical protein